MKIIRYLNIIVGLCAGGLVLLSAYKLIIDQVYSPYFLLLLMSIIFGTGSIAILRLKAESKFYAVASSVNLVNGILLLSCSVSPVLLKASWNFAFAIQLILILFSLSRNSTPEKKVLHLLNQFSIYSFGGISITALIIKTQDTILYQIGMLSFVLLCVSQILIFWASVDFRNRSIQIGSESA